MEYEKNDMSRCDFEFNLKFYNFFGCGLLVFYILGHNCLNISVIDCKKT